MTLEEVELVTDICDFTTLSYAILRHKSSEWFESSIESDFALTYSLSLS